ncbi:MAG: hypothetical protein ABIZ52_08905 [Candidatus Limnocylindrales bacterium]
MNETNSKWPPRATTEAFEFRSGASDQEAGIARSGATVQLGATAVGRAQSLGPGERGARVISPA